MDYFCQECAARANWQFEMGKAFQHSCQRCFRNLPCNDFGNRKAKVNITPAPVPKDLVAQNVNSQSEVTLPKARNVVPVPVPVYEVSPPVIAPCEAPTMPQLPDERTEVDKALDAVQPNRPGIKVEAVDRNGRAIPPMKKPKFDVDETAEKQ